MGCNAAGDAVIVITQHYKQSMMEQLYYHRGGGVRRAIRMKAV